jgi:GNAT superfamily N-acetyltransferase
MAEPTLQVRDLQPGDRPGWENLWVHYLEFYGTALDPVVTEVTWSRFNDPAERMYSVVAERGGELVGFAQFVLHRGTWSIGDFCYLEDLYVAEPARGRGVGRALIEAVYARADALECTRIYWLTHEQNETARALYDKVARRSGFIQYRRD